MKKLVVLTGAGISAESGISTFRDSGGLWEGYDVNEVATPEGFAANPALVLDFYNQRRRQLKEVEPNQAHRLLVQLEKRFHVVVIKPYGCPTAPPYSVVRGGSPNAG